MSKFKSLIAAVTIALSGCGDDGNKQPPKNTQVPATSTPSTVETRTPAIPTPIETRTPVIPTPVETSTPVTPTPVETQTPVPPTPVETSTPTPVPSRTPVRPATIPGEIQYETKTYTGTVKFDSNVTRALAIGYETVLQAHDDRLETRATAIARRLVELDTDKDNLVEQSELQTAIDKYVATVKREGKKDYTGTDIKFKPTEATSDEYKASVTLKLTKEQATRIDKLIEKYNPRTGHLVEVLERYSTKTDGPNTMSAEAVTRLENHIKRHYGDKK